MPLFVPSQELVERMQLDAGVTGVQFQVHSAIKRAQLYVQGKVDGRLVRCTYTSMFFLDKDAFSGIRPGGVYRIELPCGMVRNDTPVSVSVSQAVQSDYMGSTISAYRYGTLSGPFQTLTPADPTLYKIDYARGYLLMSEPDYGNCFVQVTFDAGFEPGTNPLSTTGQSAYNPSTPYVVGQICVDSGSAWINTDSCTGVQPSLDLAFANWSPATIPMEELPDQIAEAILAYAPIILDAAVSKDRNIERTEKFQLAESFVIEQLKPYIRYKGFSFRPIWTDQSTLS